MPINPNSSRRRRLSKRHPRRHGKKEHGSFGKFYNWYGNTGESGRTVWTRRLLEEYLKTPAIEKPLLDADGVPVTDQFGRQTDETPHYLRLLIGGVYMSKQFLRAIWKEVFNEDYNAIDFPEHYEESFNLDSFNARTARLAAEPKLRRDGYVRATEMASYSHPMNHHLLQLKRDGAMIPFGRSRYFPSEAECEAVGMRDAWVAFQMRKALHDRNPSKAIHVNQTGWESVLNKLDDYAAFDTTRCMRIAEKETNSLGEPLLGGTPLETTRVHLARWVKAGDLVKITKHMYRRAGAVTKARRYWTWRQVSPLHWMDKLVLRAYELRYRDPEARFTIADVLTWVNTMDESIADITIRNKFYDASRGPDKYFELRGDRGNYILTDRMFSALNHRDLFAEIKPTTEVKKVTWLDGRVEIEGGEEAE